MSKQAQRTRRFVAKSMTGSAVGGNKNLNPPGRGGRTGARSQLPARNPGLKSGKNFRNRAFRR